MAGLRDYFNAANGGPAAPDEAASTGLRDYFAATAPPVALQPIAPALTDAQQQDAQQRLDYDAYRKQRADDSPFASHLDSAVSDIGSNAQQLRGLARGAFGDVKGGRTDLQTAAARMADVHQFDHPEDTDVQAAWNSGNMGRWVAAQAGSLLPGAAVTIGSALVTGGAGAFAQAGLRRAALSGAAKLAAERTVGKFGAEAVLKTVGENFAAGTSQEVLQRTALKAAKDAFIDRATAGATSKLGSEIGTQAGVFGASTVLSAGGPASAVDLNASDEDFRGKAQKALASTGAIGLIQTVPGVALMHRYGVGQAATEALTKRLSAPLYKRLAREAAEQGGIGAAANALTTATTRMTHEWITHEPSAAPALPEYINSIAAGALGGVALGAPAGFRGKGSIAHSTKAMLGDWAARAKASTDAAVAKAKESTGSKAGQEIPLDAGTKFDENLAMVQDDGFESQLRGAKPFGINENGTELNGPAASLLPDDVKAVMAEREPAFAHLGIKSDTAKIFASILDENQFGIEAVPGIRASAKAFTDGWDALSKSERGDLGDYAALLDPKRRDTLARTLATTKHITDETGSIAGKTEDNQLNQGIPDFRKDFMTGKDGKPLLEPSADPNAKFEPDGSTPRTLDGEGNVTDPGSPAVPKLEKVPTIMLPEAGRTLDGIPEDKATELGYVDPGSWQKAQFFQKKGGPTRGTPDAENVKMQRDSVPNKDGETHRYTVDLNMKRAASALSASAEGKLLLASGNRKVNAVLGVVTHSLELGQGINPKDIRTGLRVFDGEGGALTPDEAAAIRTQMAKGHTPTKGVVETTGKTNPKSPLNLDAGDPGEANGDISQLNEQQNAKLGPFSQAAQRPEPTGQPSLATHGDNARGTENTLRRAADNLKIPVRESAKPAEEATATRKAKPAESARSRNASEIYEDALHHPVEKDASNRPIENSRSNRDRTAVLHAARLLAEGDEGLTTQIEHADQRHELSKLTGERITGDRGAQIPYLKALKAGKKPTKAQSDAFAEISARTGDFEDASPKQKAFAESLQKQIDANAARASKREPAKPQAAASTAPINVYYGANEAKHLSNLAARSFEFGGRKFHSVEHAYQSLKSGTFDKGTSDKYSGGGRKIPGDKGTRTADGYNIKLMKDLIKASFAQNPTAREALLATGDAPITHTQDRGIWREAFPKALMEVRSEARGDARKADTLAAKNEKNGTASLKRGPNEEQRRNALPKSAEETVARVEDLLRKKGLDIAEAKTLNEHAMEQMLHAPDSATYDKYNAVRNRLEKYVDERINAISRKPLEAVAQRARELIAKKLGHIVDLSVDELNISGVLGVFSVGKNKRGMITLFTTMHDILRANIDDTTNHEIGHAAVTIFDQVLGRAATKKLVDRANTPEVRAQLEERLTDESFKYADASPEERFVEAYAQWAAGKLDIQPKGVAARVFAAVKELIAKLRGDLTLKTAFEKIDSGGLVDLVKSLDPERFESRANDKDFITYEQPKKVETDNGEGWLSDARMGSRADAGDAIPMEKGAGEPLKGDKGTIRESIERIKASDQYKTLSSLIRSLSQQKTLRATVEGRVATQKFIDSLSKAMGVEPLRVTSHTEGTARGKIYTTDKGERVISLHDDVAGAARMSTLLHEFGHHVFTTKFDGASPEVKTALMADFDAWVKQHPLGKAAFEVRASRAPFFSSLKTLSGISRDALGPEMSDKPGTKHAVSAEYLLSVDEYFADSIARALEQHEGAQTLVGKFFGNLAKITKLTYDLLRGADPRLSDTPASVKEWVGSLWSAEHEAAGAESISPPGDAPAASTRHNADGQSTAAAAHTAADATSVLSPDSRNILASFFRRKDIMSQMLEGSSKETQVALMSRDTQLTSAINRGFAMWAAGKLNITDKGALAPLRQLRDAVMKMFGFATKQELAERALADLKAGKVDTKYDVRNIVGNEKRAALRAKINAGDSVAKTQLAANKALRTTNQLIQTKMKPVYDRVLVELDKRMRDTGIPAFHQLASLVHLQTNEFRSDGQQSQAQAITQTRNQYWDKFTAQTEGLGLRDQAKLLKALRTKGKLPPSPLEDKRVAIRGLLDEMHKYLTDAGVKVGKIEDFYPVVVDPKKMQNRGAAFRELFNDPKLGKAMRAYFERKGWNTGKMSQGDMVEKLYDMATKEFDYSTAGTSYTDGLLPGGKELRTRVSEFVYQTGDAKLINQFARFQSGNLEQTLIPYVSHVVRAAESTRRFGGGKLEALMTAAREQGASPEQVQLAKDFVNASLGSYGTKRNPFLSKMLGSMDSVFGTKMADANSAQFRNVSNAIIAYQNLRVLGLGIFGNMIDPLGVWVRSSNGLGTISAYRNGLAALRAKHGEDNYLRDMAHAIGTVERHAVSEQLAYNYGGTGQNLGALSNRVNKAIFKVNGMEMITSFARMAATDMANSFILRHALAPGKHSERYLRELNLTPADVKPDPAHPGYLLRSDKIDKAIFQFVDESVLRPVATQRPLWHNDPHFAVLAQYKGYLYSFYNTIVKRMVNEVGHGNVQGMAPVIGYLSVTLVAEALREMVQYGGQGNPNRKDWGAEDRLALVLDRSGLAGPRLGAFGDARGDLQRGNLPGQSITGPSVSQASELMKTVSGRRSAEKTAIHALPGQSIYQGYLSHGRTAGDETQSGETKTLAGT